MINQPIINMLQRNVEVFYSLYRAPVGDIYILGNKTSLNAIIFKNSYPGKTPVDSHFKKGTPAGIRDMIIFLDSYFSSPVLDTGTRPTRQTLKATVKNRSMLISHGNTTINLDLSPFSDKEIAVYYELLKIPSGKTVSYGDLALRAGIPRGARFVGNAMAKNNFPIIIPCHRVIKSDGSMGNYSGGVNIKKYLLDHEK